MVAPSAFSVAAKILSRAPLASSSVSKVIVIQRRPWLVFTLMPHPPLEYFLRAINLNSHVTFPCSPATLRPKPQPMGFLAVAKISPATGTQQKEWEEAAHQP
jgi:hypothetical protein